MAGAGGWHSEAMTYDRVIVPVDFSEVSIAAIDHGRWLAGRLGAELELLAVTTDRYVNVTNNALDHLLREGEAEQRGGAATAVAARRRVVVAADDDDVEAQLVSEVLSSPGALWCVGSHGRTALGELLFGSVSADLVRDAQVPIVVVGREARTRTEADVLAVALDGSELSETILPAALELAGSLGLRLRLLQVGHADVPADAMETAYLARVSERLPDPDHADYDTLRGDAAEELVGYVDRTDDVAMIAMATRGIPGGARISVASTSMRVVRRADVPVLLLHPRVEGDEGDHDDARSDDHRAAATAEAEPTVDRRRRVVVGVDTLGASAPAVEWAAEAAHQREAVLQVVHTWTMPVLPSGMYSFPLWPDIEAARQAALDEVESTASAIAATHPELRIETVVAEGNAAEVLAERSEGAELVVLGRHRHGRIAQLLLGSTAGEALHKVRCPMVVVPCEEPDVGDGDDGRADGAIR